MDGNGPVGGVRNTSINPLDTSKPEEVVHKRSSRLNRAVKKVGVKLKLIPKRSQGQAGAKRQPEKKTLQSRNVAISRPQAKDPGGVKPQADLGKSASAKLDDLLNTPEEKLSNPEVKRQFQDVRNEYTHAALRVVTDAIAEATDKADDELAETLLDAKFELQQHLAETKLEVTPETVQQLQGYPRAFADYIEAVGGSGENVFEAFKQHVADSDAKQTEFGQLQFSRPGEGELHAKSTHDHKELFKLQTLQFRAAKDVVAKQLVLAQHDHDKTLQSKLTQLDQQLDEQYHQLERTVQLSGDEYVTKAEAKNAKEHYPLLLKEALVDAGVEASVVDGKFQEAFAEQLNNREWKAVHKEFEHDGRTFSSTQTPASQLQAGDEESRLLDYDGDGGVSCADTKNIKHATNLLRSDFEIGGRNEFTGIRHGIADPYGLKGADAKEMKVDGARKKAEEILVAALATKPELFAQALKAAETGQDIPELFTTSTSLVTTGIGSGKEAKMQKAQNEAFKQFTDPKNQPVEIELPGPDGNPRKIKLMIRQSRFNIPVNWGGVGALSLVFGGRRNQARMNQQAMADLVGRPGRGGEIGGRAAQWLSNYDQKLTQLNHKLVSENQKTNPDTALIQSLEQETAQLEKDKKSIEDLSHQIRDIYRQGSHHHHHHDAYKLAARVALLTHKLGDVPLMNCKSGKDRTGMLDAEIKFLAARIKDDGSVPEPGSLNSEEQALFREMLLKSGNHEVQEMNVGVRGYKTEGVGSIEERVGDGTVREEVRGLSKTVGS